MSTPAIDYDALAAKHGAQGVDYDALAQKHGADQTSVFSPQQSETLHNLGQAGVGAAKGLLHTVTALPAMAGEKINSLLGHKQPESVTGRDQLYAPTNTAQSVGHGIEQAGEFLVPGLGEEGIAAKAGKFAPLARVGLNALSTGTLNKVQGGSFGVGAAGGVAGGAIGEGLRSAAPKLAESAIGITKADRGFGKSPGQAILKETSGIRPSTISESAQTRLNELNPQLTEAANNASIRPAPKIKGFLQPPMTETRLPSSPDVEGTLSRPVVLNQADRPMMRPQLPVATRTTPLSSHADVFPDQLPHGTTNIPSVTPAPAKGLGQAQYIGEIPGERGGAGQPHGVMLSRPEMSGSIPPAFEANPSASLRPARGVITGAQGEAIARNAPTTLNQLAPMGRQLGQRISGEPIPEMITPRDLLNLRRGFNDEFGQWNPETLPGVAGTGRQAYHALTNEFHNAVPGTGELDQQIANLIPVVKRAESTSRNPPLIQRTAGRIGAHTGALTGAALGATEGRREGGLPGMLVGGTAGLLLPELIATPEGRMIAARMMASPTGKTLIGSPAKGALLQLNRGGQQ
jgi:hypothetical protein